MEIYDKEREIERERKREKSTIDKQVKTTEICSFMNGTNYMDIRLYR